MAEEDFEEYAYEALNKLFVEVKEYLKKQTIADHGVGEEEFQRYISFCAKLKLIGKIALLEKEKITNPEEVIRPVIGAISELCISYIKLEPSSQESILKANEAISGLINRNILGSLKGAH